MKLLNGKFSHRDHRGTEKRRKKEIIPIPDSSPCLCVIREMFLSILIIIAGMACSRSTGQEPSAFGNKEINRIISAAPSNTEIIIALGMGDCLIAIDPYSRNIPGVQASLPEIDFFFPDTEAVIGLEPDLIFVNEINSFGVADNPFTLLRNLGIRVIEVPTSTSIEGICGDILFIAETLSAMERGEALVSSMKEEIESIRAAGEKMPERKSVYFEVSSIPSMVSFGRGTYLNEMIEIAGGQNIFADEKGWFSPSAEEIVARDPELIFTLIYHGVESVSEIMGRRAFENINAVKQNRVFVIDADSASRPSNNILGALREMAVAMEAANAPGEAGDPPEEAAGPL